MAELREARLVHVTFKDGQPVTNPNLPGVELRAAGTHGATLECRGSLDALLAWLARRPVADLRIEPLGLSSTYHRFHGVEA
jgi:hypothetical protein